MIHDILKHELWLPETTSGVGCSHSHHDCAKIPERCMCTCATPMLCVHIKKRGGGRLRVSRNIFRRRRPRSDDGQTVYMKTASLQRASCTFPGSISPATDTLDCHYLFLHARICFAALCSFFSLLLSCRAVFPVSTLFAPFVAQGGIVVADF